MSILSSDLSFISADDSTLDADDSDTPSLRTFVFGSDSDCTAADPLAHVAKLYLRCERTQGENETLRRELWSLKAEVLMFRRKAEELQAENAKLRILLDRSILQANQAAMPRKRSSSPARIPVQSSRSNVVGYQGDDAIRYQEPASTWTGDSITTVVGKRKRQPSTSDNLQPRTLPSMRWSGRSDIEDTETCRLEASDSDWSRSSPPYHSVGNGDSSTSASNIRGSTPADRDLGRDAAASVGILSDGSGSRTTSTSRSPGPSSSQPPRQSRASSGRLSSSSQDTSSLDSDGVANVKDSSQDGRRRTRWDPKAGKRINVE